MFSVSVSSGGVSSGGLHLKDNKLKILLVYNLKSEWFLIFWESVEVLSSNLLQSLHYCLLNAFSILIKDMLS